MEEAAIKKIFNDLIKPLDTRLKKIESSVKAANFTAVKKDILALRTDLSTLEEKLDTSEEIVVDADLMEFDNPISEADYYTRYPFVKQHQDIHGGTAWENYLSPGKADGRTWKKIKMSDLKLKELKINESFN